MIYQKRPPIFFSIAWIQASATYNAQKISKIIFPGTSYITTIALTSDHLCNILLHGSEDLSLEEIKKRSLTMSSNLSMNLGVSITMNQPHTTKACKIVLKYSLAISNTHMHSLSLSLSHTHTHIRTHARTNAPTHTHTHTFHSLDVYMLLCVYLHCPLYLYVYVLREETY